MTGKDGARMRLDCTECHFSRVVRFDDDVLPAEVVVEHGRETGHRVAISRTDSEEC